MGPELLPQWASHFAVPSKLVAHIHMQRLLFHFGWEVALHMQRNNFSISANVVNSHFAQIYITTSASICCCLRCSENEGCIQIWSYDPEEASYPDVLVLRSSLQLCQVKSKIQKNKHGNHVAPFLRINPGTHKCTLTCHWDGPNTSCHMICMPLLTQPFPDSNPPAKTANTNEIS